MDANEQTGLEDKLAGLEAKLKRLDEQSPKPMKAIIRTKKYIEEVKAALALPAGSSNKGAQPTK